MLTKFIFTVIVTIVSLLIHPHDTKTSGPISVVLRRISTISVTILLAPFTGVKKRGNTGHHNDSLSSSRRLRGVRVRRKQTAVSHLIRTGSFSPRISRVLHGILALSRALAHRVVIPHASVVYVRQSRALRGVLGLYSHSKFSHIPIVNSSISSLINITCLGSTIHTAAFGRTTVAHRIRSVIHSPVLIPRSGPISSLFRRVRHAHRRITVIISRCNKVTNVIAVRSTVRRVINRLRSRRSHARRTSPRQVNSGG